MQQDSSIQSLIYDHLQFVFSYLTTREVSALACTCRHFAKQAQIHWQHECKKHLMKEVLLDYYASPQLLPKCERHTYDILRSGRYTYRWLHQQCHHKQATRRISSSKMGYNIIGSPSWLCFQFYHTFPEVLPGCYKMKLNMMNVCTVKRIAHQYPRMKVWWDGGVAEYSIVAIAAKKKWKNFGRVFMGRSVQLDKSFSFHYDKENGCCDFTFEDMILRRIGDVTIEFTHIADNSDRPRVFTDYVELVRI